MAVSRHDATPSDQAKLIHHLRGRNPVGQATGNTAPAAWMTGREETTSDAQAVHLHLHPNSVTYRLGRWAGPTGLDPRTYDGLT